MCTVSWIHDSSGYQLLCNRDEKTTRGPALLPAVSTRNGVRYIAPLDGDFGGTWIATNEFGLTVTLVNGLQSSVSRREPSSEPEREPESRSRGRLVLDLVRHANVSDAHAALGYARLSDFLPFTLLAIEPNHPASLFEWDGRDLIVTANAERCMPLIASSFDTEGVRASRRQELQQHIRAAHRLDAEVLFAFHQSHGSGPSAYSPCMHRPDASTVSFTWVTVTASEIRFLYSPSAPCHWAPGETLHLDRAEMRAYAAS